MRRWYGYVAAQGITLTTWGVAYLTAEIRPDPVPGSWTFLDLGLVLALISVVPLALIFGVIDGVIAAPGTAERLGVAFAAVAIFALVAAGAARYFMDVGDVSPPDQLQSMPGEWVGVLIGQEIGLVLQMLVGLGVSVVLGLASATQDRS